MTLSGFENKEGSFSIDYKKRVGLTKPSVIYILPIWRGTALSKNAKKGKFSRPEISSENQTISIAINAKNNLIYCVVRLWLESKKEVENR